MTDNNNNMTTDVPGQENATSQIKNNVELLGGKMTDLKNTTVEGISGKEKETTLGEQAAAAGEAMSTDAAAAKTAVDKAIHDNVTGPSAEVLTDAPAAKTAVDKAVKDNVTDPAAEAIKVASEEVKPI